MSQIIGHRGAAGLLAENTLPSIQKAFELGANGVEIDVHQCRSGEIVVIHDETLDRTTNGKGKIENYSLEELKEFKIEESFKIPTLSEVLQIIPKNTLLNIELKGKSIAKAVYQELQKEHYNFDQILFSSFDHDQLWDLKHINTELGLGVLTEDSMSKVFGIALELNAFSIHPPFKSLSKNEVEIAHKAGFEIFTWTVNNAQDIEKMIQWNVGGIITDFPNFAQ